MKIKITNRTPKTLYLLAYTGHLTKILSIDYPLLFRSLANAKKELKCVREANPNSKYSLVKFRRID